MSQYSTKSIRPNKGKSIVSFPSDYVLVDLETTGLSPVYDSIIEMSAVRVRNSSIVESFSTLVSGSDVYIDSFIEKLTGITQEMVDSAPAISDVFSSFIDFIGDDIIVGHNVSFDVSFIYDNCLNLLGRHFTNNFIDTMRISRKLHPELSHHRLKDLASLFKIDYSHAHRSKDDCLITYHVFKLLSAEVLDSYTDFSSFSDLFNKNHLSTKANDIVASCDDINPDNPIYGKIVVFTGVLEKMQRKDAMQIVANLGGINGDNITKKTNFLILGNNDYCASIKDGKSSKQKKAEKYKESGCDIEIIPEDVFYSMIDF